MSKAREVLQHTDEMHMASAPMRRLTEHSAGTYVLVKYRSGSAPTRLHTSWKGPLKVFSNTTKKIPSGGSDPVGNTGPATA